MFGAHPVMTIALLCGTRHMSPYDTEEADDEGSEAGKS